MSVRYSDNAAITLTNKANTFTVSPQIIQVTTTPTANYGTLSVGTGPWDGVSAGRFNGSALGTILAVASSTGYTGMVFDVQTGGTSRFKVSSSGSSQFGGSVNLINSPAVSANFGLLNLGPAPTDGVSSGFFTGSASGTFYMINAANGSTCDLANWQIFGVPKFKVDSTGAITAAGAFNDGTGVGTGARIDNFYQFT